MDGSIFCFKYRRPETPNDVVTAENATPYGPLHPGMPQAKAWARRQPLTPGEAIGFAEVRAIATAKVTVMDLDFGGNEPTPPEPAPAAESVQA